MNHNGRNKKMKIYREKQLFKILEVDISLTLPSTSVKGDLYDPEICQVIKTGMHKENLDVLVIMLLAKLLVASVTPEAG